MHLFALFARASDCELNLSKCSIVPLWEYSDGDAAGLLVFYVPESTPFSVGPTLKILGIYIGLGTGDRNYTDALRKVERRVHLIREWHLGLSMTVSRYNILAFSCLQHVI